jgi:hypothetical protein
MMPKANQVIAQMSIPARDEARQIVQTSTDARVSGNPTDGQQLHTSTKAAASEETRIMLCLACKFCVQILKRGWQEIPQTSYNTVKRDHASSPRL